MATIHPQARTAPIIRAEIQASKDTQRVLAARYNLSVQTVRKWQKRESTEDRPHRPHTLHTTLNAVQELIVVELRR